MAASTLQWVDENHAQLSKCLLLCYRNRPAACAAALAQAAKAMCALEAIDVPLGCQGYVCLELLMFHFNTLALPRPCVRTWP